MGKTHPIINQAIADWIKDQKIFFVSTAPLDEGGWINCSPKGMDSLRVLDEKSLAYLDLTGSGIETSAHLKENGRIVLMMCAFDGPPRIMRFHGKGVTHWKGSPDYDRLISLFEEYPGARSIIEINVERIGDSCGYSIPLMNYSGERDTLVKWAEKKGESGIEEYQAQKNARSIQGLPGVE